MYTYFFLIKKIQNLLPLKGPKCEKKLYFKTFMMCLKSVEGIIFVKPYFLNVLGGPPQLVVALVERTFNLNSGPT